MKFSGKGTAFFRPFSSVGLLVLCSCSSTPSPSSAGASTPSSGESSKVALSSQKVAHESGTSALVPPKEAGQKQEDTGTRAAFEPAEEVFQRLNERRIELFHSRDGETKLISGTDDSGGYEYFVYPRLTVTQYSLGSVLKEIYDEPDHFHEWDNFYVLPNGELFAPVFSTYEWEGGGLCDSDSGYQRTTIIYQGCIVAQWAEVQSSSDCPPTHQYKHEVPFDYPTPSKPEPYWQCESPLPAKILEKALLLFPSYVSPINVDSAKDVEE